MGVLPSTASQRGYITQEELRGLKARGNDTPIKAIRKKCLDCSCWETKGIRDCDLYDCPLWPYRMGCRVEKAERLGYLEMCTDPTEIEKLVG